MGGLHRPCRDHLFSSFWELAGSGSGPAYICRDQGKCVFGWRQAKVSRSLCTNETGNPDADTGRRQNGEFKPESLLEHGGIRGWVGGAVQEAGSTVRLTEQVREAGPESQGAGEQSRDQNTY